MSNFKGMQQKNQEASRASDLKPFKNFLYTPLDQSPILQNADCFFRFRVFACILGGGLSMNIEFEYEFFL